MRDTLVIDKPEQLKALGHPLRVRTLEMLGNEQGWTLTNRQLAEKLGVDPGHLHFHVRMLLRAGLIELVPDGKGREKPYRAVARTIRVAPDLLSSGGAKDLQAALLDEVQREYAAYAPDGRFRSAQLTLRLSLERALELMLDSLKDARAREDENDETIVITMFAAPPAARD